MGRHIHVTLKRALAGALMLVFVLRTAVPPAAAGDWRDALAASQTTQTPLPPRDLKADVAERLTAHTPSGPMDASVVAAVAAGARDRYADEVRPASAADAEAVFASDKAVAVGLQALLNGNQDTEFVDLLADLVRADRMSVAAMVDDARLLAEQAGRKVPGGEVRRAEQALARADDAWSRGQPVNVISQLAQAASGVFAVLDSVGVRYDADADLDADGATDLVELRFGADPRRADTDGDGLTDGFEIYSGVPYLSPVQADTDGDGTGDANEDIDSDGLTARVEQDLGTSDLEPDTDGDGVDDGDEVDAGTDPLVPDQSSDAVTIRRSNGVAVHLVSMERPAPVPRRFVGHPAG